jgi:hypothetical protein
MSEMPVATYRVCLFRMLLTDRRQDHCLPFQLSKNFKKKTCQGLTILRNQILNPYLSPLHRPLLSSVCCGAPSGCHHQDSERSRAGRHYHLHLYLYYTITLRLVTPHRVYVYPSGWGLEGCVASHPPRLCNSYYPHPMAVSCEC